MDNKRTSSTYSEKRVLSIQEKETHQNINIANETAVISNSAPLNERLREEEVVSEGDAGVCAISPSMELQTYKSLLPLLPAQEDRIEETPPGSIFMIDVDVLNHTAPDYLLTLEKSRDKIDTTGG